MGPMREVAMRDVCEWIVVAISASLLGVWCALMWRELYWYTPVPSIVALQFVPEFLVSGLLMGSVGMTAAMVISPRYGDSIARTIFVLVLAGNFLTWLVAMGLDLEAVELVISTTATVWGYSPTSTWWVDGTIGVPLIDQFFQSLPYWTSLGGSIVGAMVVWLWIRPWWYRRLIRSWVRGY